MSATEKMAAIHVFNSRDSEDYNRVLSELLSLETKSNSRFPGLLDSAQPIQRNLAERFRKSHSAVDIERVISIDLIGMTGTVLLDRDGRYTSTSHFLAFRELAQQVAELNRNGIAVRVRFLFQYPYSLAGQNRILAEGWKNRTMIGDGEDSLRDEARLAPHLTEADIQRSQLLTVQRYCIETFQHLFKVEASGVDESESVNRFTMRFACVSTLHCGLRINSRFFCDPYHYGRERGRDTCAFNLTPITMLTSGTPESGPAYDSFCNHFRYIWECDSTLEFSDVIDQTLEISPVSVKRPGKVRHENKALRLRSSRSLEQDVQDPSYWESYQKNLLRIVDRICPIVGRVDFPEVGFLAAAWEERDGVSALCEPASLLDDYFRQDFGSRDDVRVTVLRGEMGQLLSQELFQSLEASTFGIAVLTKDILEKFSKPNVYIELGYLLRHNGPDRTFVIAESGVEIGSDLANMFYSPFNRDPSRLRVEMTRIYCSIVRAMRRSGVISRETHDRIIASRRG